MGADLESDSRCNGCGKGSYPMLGATAKIDAAKYRTAGIIGGALRQAEQDHGAIAEKTRHQPLMRRDLLIDQRVEILQHLARHVHSKRFTERSEAGQVDEDDRRVLANRLQQEFWIFCEPVAKYRCLKLLQQFTGPGERLRLAAVQPELDRAE